MVFIAIYIIVYVVLFSTHDLLRWIYIGNLGAIIVGIVVNQIYLRFFDKRDLLKDDDGNEEDKDETENE